MDDQKVEMRRRAKESKKAFRELYTQHKLWVKAYMHSDLENVGKLAKERDSAAAKALETYREADELLKSVKAP